MEATSPKRDSFESAPAEAMPVNESTAAVTDPSEGEALVKLQTALDAIDADAVLPEEPKRKHPASNRFRSGRIRRTRSQSSKTRRPLC